jgi:uncharacterized membrane protein YedE/YeeE
MQVVAALVAGLVFGLGLTISSMVDPGKVQGFLDVAGDWDPSLAFVMGGAVSVAFIGFTLAGRRATPLLAETFRRPTASGIDSSLLGGAVLFGLGWGLAGFCPGPALAALGFAGPGAAIFVVAMLAGMLLYRLPALLKAK